LVNGHGGVGAAVEEIELKNSGHLPTVSFSFTLTNGRGHQVAPNLSVEASYHSNDTEAEVQEW